MVPHKLIAELVLLFATKGLSKSGVFISTEDPGQPKGITPLHVTLRSEVIDLKKETVDPKVALRLAVFVRSEYWLTYNFTSELFRSLHSCLCNISSFSCEVNVLDRVVTRAYPYSQNVHNFFCGELKDVSMACWRMTAVGENCGQDGVGITLAGKVVAIVTIFDVLLGFLFRWENVTCVNAMNLSTTTTAPLTTTLDTTQRPELTDNDTKTKTVILAVSVPVGALVLVVLAAGIAVYNCKRRSYNLNSAYALYQQDDSVPEGNIIQLNNRRELQ